MWCWRRTEKIKWSDKVTNEQVLYHIREEGTLIIYYVEKAIGLVIISEEIAFFMMPLKDRLRK